MGLDDFLDDDGGNSKKSKSTSSSKSKSSGGTSQLLERDNWTKDEYGNVKRKGPLGYPSREEYEETFVDEVEHHGDLFKYFMPMFPQIERGQLYEVGKRYKMSKIPPGSVTCICVREAELRKIPREMVMLDSGSTEKKECIEALSERFGEEVDGSTTVYMHMFCVTRHTVKLAMADEFVNVWNLDARDRALKAVYGESWTQEFREKDTGKRDLKGIDDMEEW